MRGIEVLEAYLDDFNTIRFYFNKISYGGVSKKFYLKKEDGTSIELKIKKIEEHSRYTIYDLDVDGIIIGENYFVEHEFARKTPLRYGLVVKKARFDEMFKYDGDDLGATFTKDTTTFKVFAPTANKLELVLEDEVVEMEKEVGIFKVSVPRYLHNQKYKYRVYCNGTIKETIDPYCIKTTNNSTYSIAYDVNTLNDDSFVTLEKYSDAIIYEASVDDFTAQFEQGPSTYVSMAKERCVYYLKSLGITHLQLLPVTSCGSTDDFNPKLHYNWGYDITHFQALTNRYALKDAVIEFKALVETYHKQGIAINLDMVFNHVHDYDTSPMQILVPYYYFQIDKYGNLSNASYCGNDYDSTRAMSSKLVVDSCLSWVKNFKVDGFRFDLMGIIDVDTMNAIYDKCSAINPSFMLYGEGWNMPSLLEEHKRATIQNQAQMPNIAHFNDFFRDIIKGKEKERGYLTNGHFYGDNAKTAILCDNYINPKNSINYLECHDNMTLFDHLLNVCNEKPEIRLARMKLSIAVIILSYGIPFIHSGLEYARSKNGLDNTYRDNSGINQFNWNLIAHPLVAFTRKLIQIRKDYPELRFDLKQDVLNHVRIGYLYEDVITYKVNNLVIVLNPTYHETFYAIEGKSLIDNAKMNGLKVKPHSVYIIDTK